MGIQEMAEDHADIKWWEKALVVGFYALLLAGACLAADFLLSLGR